MNIHATIAPNETPADGLATPVRLESEKAPIHIGSVSLVARNATSLAAFYQDVIGLDVINQTDNGVSLGSGGVAYLHLINSPAAHQPRQPTAGLFHTAFLLPSRAALGAWFSAARDRGVPIEAASDHDVSEAFYLTDPEGNGIEVYADRDRSLWQRQGDGFAMTTGRMDVEAVVEAGRSLVGSDGVAAGRFPQETRIGHVHLSVGDIAAAERFYNGVLGLDITHKRPGGSFFSSGGYHHHIAANTWHSQGALLREEGTVGLANVEFFVCGEGIMAQLAATLDIDAAATQASLAAEDPWGTRLTFTEL